MLARTNRHSDRGLDRASRARMLTNGTARSVPIALRSGLLLLAASLVSVPAHADGAATMAEEQGPRVELSVPMAPGLPELQRRSAGSPWQPACEAPCGLRLDPRYDYRIGGRGVVTSDSFRLPPEDAVHVRAKVGSSVLWGVGTGAMVFGALFAAAGGAVLLLPEHADASADDKSSKVVVGVGFLVMGILTAGLGVLLHEWMDTTVTVSTPREAARSGVRWTGTGGVF